MATRRIRNPISVNFPRSPLPRAFRNDKVPLDRDGRELQGKPRPMTSEEIENIPYQYKFDCRLFNMAVPDDVEAFKKLQEFLLNKRFLLRKRHDLLDSEAGTVRIYMEWVDPFREIPPAPEVGD